MGPQLIAVYCRPEALTEPGPTLKQFLDDVSQIPIPVSTNTLIISDNADIHGTLEDLLKRQGANEQSTSANNLIMTENIKTMRINLNNTKAVVTGIIFQSSLN